MTSLVIPIVEYLAQNEYELRRKITGTRSNLGVLTSAIAKRDSQFDPIYNYGVANISEKSQLNNTHVQSWNIALLYETEYREDELLIQKDGKWYGVWSYSFRQAYSKLVERDSVYREKNRRIWYDGYPYNQNPSDLVKAINNDTFEIYIITKELNLTPFDSTSEFDNLNNDPAIVSAWNDFKFVKWNSYVSRGVITEEFMESLEFVKDLGRYTDTRNRYIGYCKNIQNKFIECIKALKPFFDEIEDSSGEFKLSALNWEDIREALNYHPGVAYIRYRSGNYTGDYRLDLDQQTTCYYVGCEIVCDKAFSLNFVNIKNRLFPKATNTLLLTNCLVWNESESVYTEDLTSKGADYDNLNFYLRMFLGRNYFYLSTKPNSTCKDPKAVAINQDGKVYYNYIHEIRAKFNNLYEYHRNVTIELFQTQNIQEVLSEAEKYNDSDDLIFFGPDFRRKTKFKSIGYNVIQTENDSFGNVYIRYKFDESTTSSYYMRTKGWNFVLEDETIIPWYFVRSSDYNDWINKFNENRNATTAYRKIESGSDTTTYFKDSETGMTGAIEASNYFKTLFEDTSYLQNDDLDGIGEICSSILAVEKDFYESLNENSESTVDFKSYNTYYIELLENQVDELHLLITEQEEITNDIRTKFSEILDLIHTFYTNELPLPKEPVTPKDILKSQINIFDKKNILSIFN